jgi:hypothetical protein
MFSFSNLRNRKKTVSPTVAADASLLLSTEAVHSDGESRLDDDFTHLVTMSTARLEMTETFLSKSSAAMDSESDFADWEHVTSADATTLDLVAESKHEENKQVVREIVSTLVEDAISLADQKRQQEEARMLEEQTQRCEAAANRALLLAKQQLQAEAERKPVPLLVSPPALPVSNDDYLSIKPPIPYSTLFCMNSLRANRGLANERIQRESGLYQQQAAQMANVKAGVQAARQNMSGANGVFSVGQSPYSGVTGFFRCFLGLPLTAAGELLSSQQEDSAQNTQNYDAVEDAATLAMLTYGH